MEYVTIIILLIGAAATIYEKIQEKKRERRDLRESGGVPPEPAARPAFPSSMEQWQHELKRLLEEKRPPQQPPPQASHPPVMKPMIIPTLLEPGEGESRVSTVLSAARAGKSRAEELHGADHRLTGPSQRATRVKRDHDFAALPKTNTNFWITHDIVKDRRSLQRAVLASVILAPPRSTEI